MPEQIDAHALKWICNSSLDDAKRYIRQANAATLRAAIATFGDQPRISYRKLIDRRIRQLKKEGK